MSENVSVEFLEANGFRLKPFSDGMYWIRTYMEGYYLQVNEALTDFTEDDQCFIEDLDEAEFISTVERHHKAITE